MHAEVRGGGLAHPLRGPDPGPGAPGPASDPGPVIEGAGATPAAPLPDADAGECHFVILACL